MWLFAKEAEMAGGGEFRFAGYSVSEGSGFGGQKMGNLSWEEARSSGNPGIIMKYPCLQKEQKFGLSSTSHNGKKRDTVSPLKINFSH